MVIAITVVCLFLASLFVKTICGAPLRELEEENRRKDREMAEEITQALRDTSIIEKYETVKEEMLQPYARRLWRTECPVEQIQIGMEVADFVTKHAELVEVDAALHRRSQFTLIINKKYSH